MINHHIHQNTLPSECRHYLNRHELIRIKKILLSWRATLVRKTDRTVSYLKREITLFPDIIDRATQESFFFLELRTEDRQQKLMRKIDLTLDRLFNNDFGYCDLCGDEIGINRLVVRPIASQCIRCKTQSEKNEV